jgi:hypothetical protein
VRRVLTIPIMLVVAAASLSGADGALGAKVQKEVRYVRIVVESGFYVDNDPGDRSGGDLFGSTGRLTRNGVKVGTFSSACVASSAEGGQCDATLIWSSGDRLQLAGEIRTQEARNQQSIVGGTGKYKRARGDATLTRLDEQGSVQRVRLRILR